MEDVILGIDLGGTNIKAGAVGPDGRVLSRCQVPTGVSGGPEAVADSIAEAGRHCIEALGGRPAAGVGIGSPGNLSVERDMVLFLPNFPGWRDIPLRQMIEDRLALPCTLENDANVAALAEQWVGAGRGAQSLVIFTLGTGIGGGIVLGGQVWHGFRGVAGEFGHMSIDLEGPPCNCGNVGCIEALASATAMVHRMRQALAAGRTSSLAGRGEELMARDIYEAAVAGDALAAENLAQTGEYLGAAVTNILHILNPQVVVLSGGVTAAGDMLMSPLMAEVNRRAMKAQLEGVKICFAGLGNDAGVIGAARCFMLEVRRA